MWRRSGEREREAESLGGPGRTEISLRDFVCLKDLSAKGFDMELDGRFHIGKSFFIGIALSYYYPFNSDWVGYIAIKMIFYNYFYRLHPLVRGISRK